MRAVVQRVHRASVEVDGQAVSEIGIGLLVYLGVAQNDSPTDSAYLAEKVRYLRVFPDESKPLNRDVLQAGGAVLAISAFTTQADVRKGRRPSLNQAAPPDEAEGLYASFCESLRGLGVPTRTGCFGAHMDVHSVNDGPICVLLDSARLF